MPVCGIFMTISHVFEHLESSKWCWLEHCAPPRGRTQKEVVCPWGNRDWRCNILSSITFLMSKPWAAPTTFPYVSPENLSLQSPSSLKLILVRELNIAMKKVQRLRGRKWGGRNTIVGFAKAWSVHFMWQGVTGRYARHQSIWCTAGSWVLSYAAERLLSGWLVVWLVGWLLVNGWTQLFLIDLDFANLLTLKIVCFPVF